MKVVGACPLCNSPIYGPRRIVQGTDIRSHFSCDCYPQILAKAVAEADLKEAEARTEERGFS